MTEYESRMLESQVLIASGIGLLVSLAVMNTPEGKPDILDEVRGFQKALAALTARAAGAAAQPNGPPGL